MVKAMIFLTRRDGLSRAEFCAWWLGPHRALAEKLPGLQRHCFNLLPEGGPHDAIVEQWFASADAMNGAYQTPEGEAVAADSAAHIKARHRTVVDEHPFAVASASS